MPLLVAYESKIPEGWLVNIRETKPGKEVANSSVVAVEVGAHGHQYIFFYSSITCKGKQFPTVHTGKLVASPGGHSHS